MTVPYNPNPKILGITFNERSLNFKIHTEDLFYRARNGRLNKIKIFVHKSWHLSNMNLKGIIYTFEVLISIKEFRTER